MDDSPSASMLSFSERYMNLMCRIILKRLRYLRGYQLHIIELPGLMRVCMHFTPLHGAKGYICVFGWEEDFTEVIYNGSYCRC